MPDSTYRCVGCGVDLSQHPVTAGAHVCPTPPGLTAEQRAEVDRLCPGCRFDLRRDSDGHHVLTTPDETHTFACEAAWLLALLAAHDACAAERDQWRANFDGQYRVTLARQDERDSARAERDRLAGRLAEVERERDRWYGKAIERAEAHDRAEALAGALRRMLARYDFGDELPGDHPIVEARALLAPAPAGPRPATLDVTA